MLRWLRRASAQVARSNVLPWLLAAVLVALVVVLALRWRRRRSSTCGADYEDDDNDCAEAKDMMKSICSRGRDIEYARKKLTKKFGDDVGSKCGFSVDAECWKYRPDIKAGPSAKAKECAKKCKSSGLRANYPCMSNDGNFCCKTDMKECVDADEDDTMVNNQKRWQGRWFNDAQNANPDTITQKAMLDGSTCSFAARMPDSKAADGWSCTKDYRHYIGDDAKKKFETENWNLQCAQSAQCAKLARDMAKTM